MAKTIIFFFFLAIALGCATSARILDEMGPQFPFLLNPIEPDEPINVSLPPTLPTAQIPITTPATASPTPNLLDTVAPPEVVVAAPVTTPSSTSPTGTATVPTTEDDVAPPVTTPVATLPTVAATVSPAEGDVVAPVTNVDSVHPALSFFMHDILGGSRPSGRVVTGIIANSQSNGLPFSKASNQILPLNGGVPLNNIKGLVNNNDVPFLVGLNGSPTSNTVLQNNGNNNVINSGKNLPFVSTGQLPSGVTLQQVMFGSITVVDNELTEGHELGSSVIGKGQSFYLSSSLDGSSHTIALTTIFHSGDDHDDEVVDTISYFGVHRTASVESHIAVIGGTGKYEHAKGYAVVETLPQVDQHTTDGIETVLHFNVYLTYE